MKPFLYKVAEATLSQYQDEICNCTFVFPNRRAGVFFQKYLADISGKPIFSPQILTVNDLFRSFTAYNLMDRISLLFTLYRHYQQLSTQEESFDDFIFWGEMILNDFDDVDKYVADARQLFANIKDLKEIEADFAGLSDEQMGYIREFWINFQPHKQGKTKDEFLATWKILHPLYLAFRAELEDCNSVYEGMIFREVAEKIVRKEEIISSNSNYIFVGLNALSRAEEILLQHLKDRKVADFFWDTESPMTTDPDNKASYFINRYKLIFPSSIKLPQDEKPNQPTIELIGISSATGQAKQVYSIINKLIDTKQIDNTEKAINTAIVLPDEQLLMPTMYSIPEAISTINVTMGYPLSSSPIAGLMEHIFAMQTHWRLIHQEPAFYYRFLLPVLNHRYISNLAPELAHKIHQHTLDQNSMYISVTDLSQNESFAQVFTPLKSEVNISAYLLNVIEIIQKNLDHSQLEQDNSKTNLSQLDIEFIYRYHTTITRMSEVMKKADIQMNSDTFFKLLRKMIAGVSIPFQGEPLSGLQIMGVLETRTLDFENLIILSMNEGVFPLKKATNSFIPYNLRKGFGLSTYEHQDSVYAYHFYRMIYRAKNIFLLYDTRSDGMQTGEVSRYVYQMKYHYRLPIVEKLITFEVALKNTETITIQKNERIVQLLSEFLEGGTRSLSASSINTYLDCSLKFYFQQIERMKEEQEITEELEASEFGSIFHLAMEKLYEPFKNREVTQETLQNLQKNTFLLTKTVQEAFREIVFKTDKKQILTGHNLLISSILQRYIHQVLQVDQKLTPFIYRESEERMEDVISTPNNLKIRLKGSIDRIDEVDKTTRIVDYKTGSAVLQFSSIEELFDITNKNRPKAVMQVFLYAWLYARKHNTPQIKPEIYYIRNVFGDFASTIMHKLADRTTSKVENFADFSTDFEVNLGIILEGIFDPSINFTQTEVEKNCIYCDFKDICRRN